MRAVAIDSFGGPELLAVRDLPDPKLGPDVVIVRVAAAGVNPVDATVRAGRLERAFPTHFPLIPGWDVSGVVAAVGPAVPEYEVGQEVIGYVRADHIQLGTYAELVRAPVRTLARKPGSLDFVAAAGLPLVGLTAWQALRAAGVGGGDTVVVSGASGGVGTAALQLARHLGARVIGTSSARNASHVESLGGVPVEYGDGVADRVKAAAGSDGVSALLDFAGGPALPELAGLLPDVSRAVSIVDAAGVKRLGGRYVFVRPDAADLARLSELVDAGELTVHVSATYPLAEAAQAHRAIESRHTRGKIVLEVA